MTIETLLLAGFTQSDTVKGNGKHQALLCYTNHLGKDEQARLLGALSYSSLNKEFLEAKGFALCKGEQCTNLTKNADLCLDCKAAAGE